MIMEEKGINWQRYNVMKVRKVILNELIEALKNIKASGEEYVELWGENTIFGDVLHLDPVGRKKFYTEEDIKALEENG